MRGEELLLLVVGGTVVALLALLIVRWSRKLDAIFPDLAKEYGLEYTREKQGSAFTNVKQSDILRGVAQGTPLQVVATYETRGRMRMRSSWIAVPAPAGVAPCTINLQRKRPAADIHLVRSGDAAFDAQWWVTSDAPAAVRALLAPAVRAELRECPQAELRLVVQGGHLVLSFPGTPSNRAELQAPVKVALALARAGGS